jgi:hypothetical protein
MDGRSGKLRESRQVGCGNVERVLDRERDNMQLEQELATYREKLLELLQHEGRYVLIHRNDVIDTFSSYEDALRQGYRQCGLQPFLVKQIRRIEPIHYISPRFTVLRGK